MTSGLTVTFVGSGDAFGSGGRLQACILLDDGEQRLLLDCGATSLVGLKRLVVDPNSINGIVLSHLHGDHFGGVPFLVLDGQFARRTRELAVWGPPGTAARLQQALELMFPGSTGVERRFAVRVTEVAPGTDTEVLGWRLETFAADHPSGAPALITRVTADGRVVAYSGDTAWTSALVDASDGADLFICESYFRDRQVPYHLGHAELLVHLPQLSCKRLVLTHMTAEMLAADNIAIEKAHDGLVIRL